QRREGAEVFARVVQMGAGIAGDQAEVEGRRDIETELGRDGEVVVVVVVTRLAGPEQVGRRDRGGAGVQVRDVGAVAEGVLRAAEAGGLVEAVEAAALDGGRELHRTRTAAGDD